MLSDEVFYILITGKQGSGKTTLAAKLEKYANSSTPGPRALREKFAGALYACSEAVLQVLLAAGIEVARDKQKTLLQLLGTEWGRKQLGEDIWVRALQGRIAASPVPGPFVIIDDCRFENEFRAFAPTHTYTIRCVASRDTRRGRCDGWRDNDSHPSETGLDHVPDAEFDFIAVTDKTLPGYQDPVSMGCAILLDLDRRFHQGVYRGQERAKEKVAHHPC